MRDSSIGIAPRFTRSASVSPYSRSNSRLRRRKGEKNGKLARRRRCGKCGKSGAFFAELFPSLSCEIRARSLARISTEAAFSTARLIASDLKTSGNLRACVFLNTLRPATNSCRPPSRRLVEEFRAGRSALVRHRILRCRPSRSSLRDWENAQQASIQRWNCQLTWGDRATFHLRRVRERESVCRCLKSVSVTMRGY